MGKIVLLFFVVVSLAACASSTPLPDKAVCNVCLSCRGTIGVVGYCPSATTREEISNCLLQEVKASEKALEELASRLKKMWKDEPEWLKEFGIAQERWRAFRESECKIWTYESRTGTAAGDYWARCLITMNRRRAESLKFLDEG